MFMQVAQSLTATTLVAFVLGVLVAKGAAYIGNRISAAERDPRDNRIRALDAELRIAKNEGEKRADETRERETSLEDAQRQLENAEIHLKTQEELIASLQNDLRDSVKKTRELRSELTDRATENLRSEVKDREVETELSVAQASTDMIATGVLDYSMGEVGDEDPDGSPEIQRSVS